ncbi:hypothetical protein CFOL_v3_07613, partial [Cephalotus follicularis]
NNELLLQNHDSRPTGSAYLPEVNATKSHFRGQGRRQQRQKWRNPRQFSNARQAQSKKGICNRCGMEGHWYRVYRTAKHWVDLYQASLKEKDKQIETNF